MINIKIESKVFERFSEVIYVLSTLISLGFFIGAVCDLFFESGSFSVFLLFVGVFFYGFGWVVRFVLTGKNNFLFQQFLLRKLNKYIELIKEKIK